MADATSAPKDLMGFLDFCLVRKAPFQIPEAGREWIVKFGPWMMVVVLLLLSPAVLFGVSSMLLPVGGAGFAAGFGSAALLLVANFALTIAALPGLFARKRLGWNLVFYARLLQLVTSILAGSVVAGLLTGLIGLYILFQIRTKYS